MTGIDIVESLSALRRDGRGNVLPMFAAALIPLLAIVGGGVDASRGYLTKTQLQSACDAGVLAGRRAMAKTGEYGESEEGKATRMFDANFDSNIVDADRVSFVTESGDEGDVFGTATARIPTVIMKLFGKYDMSFSVSCMAELQITNSDIMFVLDTTGSMAGTRISGLRDAVKDFHLTIASSVVDEDVRVRYGFVPYSMTVNARNLLTSGTMPMDYVADTVPYQSRQAYFNTPKLVQVGSRQDSTETHSNALESWQCDNYGDNFGNNPVWTESAPGYPVRTSYSRQSWSSSNGTCRRNKRVTNYKTYYEFDYWRYAQSSLDVSALKSFSGVQFASRVDNDGYVPAPGLYDIRTLALMSDTSGITRSSYTWGGCLEERATEVDEDMAPPPDGATDLDINSAPDSDETRWKPYFPRAVFHRGSSYYDERYTNDNFSSTDDFCPAPMRMFEEVDLTPNEVPDWLDDYLDDLNPVGGTYHDIGMIWGGRLGSPNGIFADIVNDQPERSVSRHIIFMTDGEMAPEIDFYSAYGMERYDNRVAPRYTSRGSMKAYHDTRFVAACVAAKAEGYTVWVIGFGSSLTSEMRSCASGHRAYFSNDNAELRATFRFIASQVADLRLGQ